jgi:hypothetical protein
LKRQVEEYEARALQSLATKVRRPWKGPLQSVYILLTLLSVIDHDVVERQQNKKCQGARDHECDTQGRYYSDILEESASTEIEEAEALGRFLDALPYATCRHGMGRLLAILETGT